MIKKIIGIVILLILFGAIFYSTVAISSLVIALINWGVAIVFVALIYFAVYLITSD